MSVPAFLRHPVVLLAAVAVVIGLIWYALGQPIKLPPSPLAQNEKLHCVSYSPFRGGQSPFDASLVIPAAQIEADLALLAPLTSCVRTYGIGMGLARVPEIARKYGLTVLQGIALGRDAGRNRVEIEGAVAVARAQRETIRALVVGNEVLSRGDMSATDLGNIIRGVREQVPVPVTYADTWDAWLKAGELADAVNFVTIHVVPYRDDFPVAAADAARRVIEIRSRVAASFPGKEILIGEVGWPSAGRLREIALPSPANQARVLHDVVAAAKAGKFQINILEGFDQPWKRTLEGTAGAHWGLFDGDTRALKFRWGGAVSNHPYWFFQALIGILFALVTFAAGFLAARSLGPDEPARIDWPPVAGIALAGGLFLGWAIANVSLENYTIIDWFQSIFLITLALVTPPIAAAAAVRRTPFEGFVALLDPLARRLTVPLARAVSLLFVLLVIAAIRIALGLVFEPRYHDFPFAALSGPVAALALIARYNPRGSRWESAAEISAAVILLGAALIILFNEGVWNWQAQWFAAVLLALAWTCLRARGVRNP